MSSMSDEHIDQHFKAAAEGVQFPFDESAWANLEKKMPGSGFGYYQIIGSVLIVLIFLVGISIYVLDSNPQKSLVEQNTEVQNNDRTVITREEPTASDGQRITSDKKLDAKHSLTTATHEVDKISLTKSNHYVISKSVAKSDQTHEQLKFNQGSNHQLPVKTSQAEYSIKLLDHLGPNLSMSRYFQTVNIQGNSNEPEPMPIVKEKLKSLIAIKLQYAPDISSVGYFKGGKIGSDWGLSIEYELNRWRLSTGVIISKKLYYTEEELSSNSYGYGTSDIQRVDADCKVLDIPINLYYKIINRALSGVYVSTGVSSYIMLSEDYEYKTDQGDWVQSYSNKNNHLFSIVNLSFGYEHQLSSKMSLQVEPFMKLPIAKIGEGKVDLVSSGAFITLKYQLK